MIQIKTCHNNRAFIFCNKDNLGSLGWVELGDGSAAAWLPCVLMSNNISGFTVWGSEKTHIKMYNLLRFSAHCNSSVFFPPM